MEITYKDNQFRIKGKTGILYSRPNGVLIESSDATNSKELSGPGEFEVSGISVIGLQTEEGNVFIYEVDGLRILNLENLNKKLSDSKLSSIGDIDILLLPVGDATLERMQQIESYYVIPFGQKTEEELDKFLKESGLTVERLPKFSLKKEEYPPAGGEDKTTEIIII